MNSTYSNNLMENSHFLSNTQEITKVSGHYNNNSSINDDGKSFLNSTLNASAYNSNAMDSRNGQAYTKSSRNGQ